MRIFCLVNNWVGWQVLQWLQEQDEEIVGLAIHPPYRQKYGHEILKEAKLGPEFVFDGSSINQPEIIRKITALKADIGLSVFFGYILKPSFIRIFPKGIVNLHPAYLPYNRGSYPNVWSILDGTPAGATLHYIDPGIDTGDIIAQREVEVEPVDTGQTLYHKLEICSLELFKDTWPLIRHGTTPRIPQNDEIGTFHRISDIEQIDKIELDKLYTARELIDLIRARTFPPYDGAYFIHQGRKVYLRLQLYYEGQTSQ